MPDARVDSAALPKACIVLVHGTFARGAPWTQPSTSSLCKRLRESLGRQTEFDAFEWSGDNRHDARVAGGSALAAHLQDLLARRSAPPLFVIGHSHGGTVIAHALRLQPQLASKLAGVVFLSTPFIQVRRRPHALALATTLGLGLFGLVFWAAGLVQDAMMGLWPAWLAKLLGVVVLLLIGGVVLSAVYETTPPGTRGKKSDDLVPRIDVAVERLQKEFAVHHLHRERTLIVRANADEASAALAWIQAVSRLLGDLVGVTLRLAHALLPWSSVHDDSDAGMVRQLARAVGVLLVVGLLVLLVGGWLQGLAEAVIAVLRWFGIDPAFELGTAIADAYAGLRGHIVTLLGLAIKVIATAIGALVLVVTFALTLFNRAFGRWFLWTALFVEVSVEPAPPGRWLLLQLEAPDQSAEWAKGQSAALTHSLSYEDPRALRAVAVWIRRRLQRAHCTADTVAP